MALRDHLPYFLRLRLLQHRQERAEINHNKKIKKLRKSGATNDQIESAEYDAQFDDMDFDGDILQMQTRHLIRCLGRYSLPFPDRADWAVAIPPHYYRHLTREAIVRVRASIRQERKERWEAATRWTPLLSALTGLLGVIAAILALFLKSHS